MRRVEEPVHRLFSRLTPEVKFYFVQHAEELDGSVGNADLERHRTGLIGICRDSNNQFDPAVYSDACNYLYRSLELYGT